MSFLDGLRSRGVKWEVGVEKEVVYTVHRNKELERKKREERGVGRNEWKTNNYS